MYNKTWSRKTHPQLEGSGNYMEYGSGPYGRSNSGPSLRLSLMFVQKRVGLPHPNIAIFWRKQGFKSWFLCLCHCTAEIEISRDIDYIENNLHQHAIVTSRRKKMFDHSADPRELIECSSATSQKFALQISAIEWHSQTWLPIIA